MSNPVQFAVVREDPNIELTLADEFECSRVLLIASGGCTALSFRSQAPKVHVSLVDMNAAQLDLVERKLEALRSQSPRELFNVEDACKSGLNAGGNFESLFRSLRLFLEDLVIGEDGAREFFQGSSDERRVHLARWTQSPYWPTAFQMHFSDALLRTMFGPAAIQHAEPGSYPPYFQKVFETGLARDNAASNYFLHHILLGHYIESCLPQYLAQRPNQLQPFDSVLGTLSDVPELDSYGLISLSNITDWMSAAELHDLSTTLERAAPGCALVFRQLNSSTQLETVLGPEWTSHDTLAARLLESDRSLFYDRLHVYVRAG